MYFFPGVLILDGCDKIMVKKESRRKCLDSNGTDGPPSDQWTWTHDISFDFMILRWRRDTPSWRHVTIKTTSRYYWNDVVILLRWRHDAVGVTSWCWDIYVPIESRWEGKIVEYIYVQTPSGSWGEETEEVLRTNPSKCRESGICLFVYVQTRTSRWKKNYVHPTYDHPTYDQLFL